MPMAPFRPRQSLPRVLDRRLNIVLSREPGFVAPGAIVARSLEEGLALRAAPRRRQGPRRSW